MKRLRDFDIRENIGLIATILGVWLAGNLIATFLLILPRSERAESTRDVVNSFRQARQQRTRDVGSLREQYERVMDGKRTLATFYKDVISTKQERMTAVQREIRQIAARYNINPETISYSKEVFEKDQIVRFSTVMPLTGSYENLRQFISSVEASENFLTVTNILLAGSKEGGIILSLNVTLATYFFDPEVVPRTPVAPAQEAGL